MLTSPSSSTFYEYKIQGKPHAARSTLHCMYWMPVWSILNAKKVNAQLIRWVFFCVVEQPLEETKFGSCK